MSELIAEARVLVTPDTTRFRALLEAEVSAASKGVAVTIPVTPVVTTGGAAGQAAQTASKEAAAAEAAIAKLAQAETVLAAADAKIVTASTQASAARSQFTAATRASLVAQQAYAKALASEDEDVIAAAAATRALTKDKQALALATLRAAQATAAEGAAQGRTAVADQAAGAAAARSSARQVATSSTEAAAANNLLARSAEVVAVAERRAAAAGSEVGAAQTIYRAQVTATTLAFRAYQEALATNDLLLRQTTRNAYAAAKGNEALALSSLEVARSAQVEASGLTKAAAGQAATLGGVSKGAGSAAASLFGLRGATLAATAPFLAGAAAAITFAKSLGLAAEFNKQLSVLKVTSGATADELARVSDAAKQLGADVSLPGVSAIDAAQAMTELSKAGLSVQDSIAGARGVLALATAAGIDNASATELAASALNAFGLAGSDALHVADVLAASANNAQGSITDVGLALQQSAAAGRQAGLSLEQTVAILTEFARAGIKGSDAGTSLRVLLLRLINPSKQAGEVIKQLGLHIRDASGAINVGLFDEFARKTKNLTAAERDRDAAIIAGQDAFRGLAILARTGGVELQRLTDEVTNNGDVTGLAAARMTGLAGAAENLKNQLSNVGLSIGQSLAPSLAEVVSGAATAVSALGSVLEEVKKLQKEAQRPIDFVINVIPGQAGGGPGGALATIKQDLIDIGTKPLPGLIFLSRLQKEVAKEQANMNAQFAKGDLAKMVADLNKAGATAPDLDKLVRKLQEIAKGTQGGSEETERFRKGLEAFIKQLQTLSAQPNIELPITLPKGLLDGTLGADAAKTTASGFANQLKNENFGFSGFVASVDFEDAGNQSGKLFSVGWAKALKDGLKTATTSALSNLNLAVAQAGGNQTQELAILRQQETRQQAFLDSLLKRPDTEKNVALATKAADNLKSTRDAIQRILDERAADAKQISDAAAAASATKQAAGDRAFLQAQEDARDRQQRLITLAGDTPGLQDDIRRQEQLRGLIKRQIAALKASALDEQAKQSALRELRKARDATTDEIKRLIATDRQQRAEQRQQALEEGLQANIDLGQSILDLTGNKDPLLRAIAAEIKHQISLRNAAKKGSVEAKNAQTEINKLLLQRRELNKAAQDAARDAQGFSGFEFLQKTQGFASNLLGNLIPGFATGGLVGNVQTAQPQQPIDGVTTQFARPGDRGVRPVQVDTTNALLRQILAAVSGRHTNPPEIRHNTRQAHAVMDTL